MSILVTPFIVEIAVVNLLAFGEFDMNMNESIKPISISEAEHYISGEVFDCWHLLQHSELSVIQERVPPGGAETKHFHSKARQFFYILSGTALLNFDGHSISLSSGQGIHVPPSVPHQFINASSEEVNFLVISSPTPVGDRIPATTKSAKPLETEPCS